MSRPIDADALIPDFLVPTSTNNTPCKRYVSMEQIHNAPTIEPEITQEDIELYCRRRCLTVIADDLYNEMKTRWSAQPTRSNAPNTLDTISRQAAIDAMYKLCDECDPCECGECRLVYDHRSDKSRDAIYVLEHLPPAQPKRKTGKWIQISPAGIYECSECGKNVMTNDIEEYKWCHGCGCKMETEE